MNHTAKPNAVPAGSKGRSVSARRATAKTRSSLKKYPIIPVAKPRMTRADKWKLRPAVLRYRAFCDEVRLRGIQVQESGTELKFCIPMPKSWSKKKRAEMVGTPHRQTPDLDNLIKAILDALYSDDSVVHQITASKVWATDGGIEVVQNLNLSV